MKTNLASWDRFLRYFLGLIMTAWLIAGGPWWAGLGVYLVLSASWGFCLFYAYFKIRTAKADASLLQRQEGKS